MNTDVMFSSATDQWATPQELFDRLDAIYHFTLDPAADDSNHKCEKYYTAAQDGLLQNWGGETVFCNPPYGREIGKWVKKAYESARECPAIVMLLPARTDTKWFHNYILNKATVHWIEGRLKFGNAKNSAPFPSMIVVYQNF